MSSFGAKRKARKITVQDDDDDSNQPSSPGSSASNEPQTEPLLPTFKTRKPHKSSSLRKSINFNADENVDESNSADATEDNEDGGAPVVVRPTPGRGATSKFKKRPNVASRLSFGPGTATTDTAGDGDGDSVLPGGEESSFSTPVKPKARSSARANLPLRGLGDEEDRPRYSKEYLSELASSTPNTPATMERAGVDEDTSMILDEAELEGAMIVETEPSSTALEPFEAPKQTAVLTESEIAERKARRARLAVQGGTGDDDYISLEDGDARGNGESYLTVLSRQTASKSRKENTRLVAEDEDLGEGFDNFVEDGGLSLGKKAEREARRKHRAEISALITAAEGDSNSESDDSEAERRAAYERAQTRKGLDGLAEEREAQRKRLAALEAGTAAPPKITPLPDLSVLAEEFRERMRRKEAEVKSIRGRLEALGKEQEEVAQRMPEVQKLLNEAGERYRALMGGDQAEAAPEAEGSGSVAAAQSLLARSAGINTPGQRGLESLGATPVRRDEMEI